MNSVHLIVKLMFICVTVLGPALAGAKTQLKASAIAEPSLQVVSPPQAVLKTKSEPSRAPLGRWEFRIAPVQLLTSFVSGDIAYRLTKRWSTGPSAVSYNSSGDKGTMFLPTIRGNAFGWNATYYTNSVAASTGYIGAHAYYQSYVQYGHANPGRTEADGIRTDLFFGYQNKWDWLTLRSGVGFQYESENVREIKPGALPTDAETIQSSRKDFVSPMVELKIGIEI